MGREPLPGLTTGRDHARQRPTAARPARDRTGATSERGRLTDTPQRLSNTPQDRWGPDGNLGPLGPELTAWFAEHDRRWGATDFRELADLWDADEPLPVYMGEEYAGPVVGWPDLNRHFSRLAARLQAASVRSIPVRLDEPAPDLARVVLLSEWALTGVENPEPRRGRSWVTALLRRRANQWRLVHYMEAPVYFEEPLEL
jgi:hypothetical protein